MNTIQLKSYVKHHKAAFILLAAITVLGFVVVVPATNSILQEYTNVSNTPFLLTYNGVQVYDKVTGASLGSSGPGSIFNPGSTKYPRINHGISQPYFVTPDNKYSSSVPDAYTTPIQSIVINGTVYYIYDLRYGVDFGVRTSGNFPVEKSYASYLAPFYMHQETLQDVYGTKSTVLLDHYGDYYETNGFNFRTKGVLAGQYDADKEPDEPTFAAGNAKITANLENIGYYIGASASVGTTNYTAAMNNLKTMYGNSMVRVVPSFKLSQAPPVITSPFTYVATQGGENVTIKITPTTNTVGFRSIYKVPGTDQNGKVANMVSSLLSKNEPVKPRTYDIDADQRTDPVVDSSDSSKTVTGYIKRLADKPITAITFFAEGADSLLVDTALPNADISDPRYISNYPSTVTISSEAYLQPETQIATAVMEVHGEMRFQDYEFWVSSYDHTAVYDANIDVYYGIEITNIYNVQTAIINTYLVVANKITMFKADGQPIDVSQYTDYQLNSILKDPDKDILIQELDDPADNAGDPWAWLGDFGLGFGISITAIISVVIVIAVLYATGRIAGVAAIFGRGKQETNRSPTKKRFSLGGRKGLQYSEG